MWHGARTGKEARMRSLSESSFLQRSEIEPLPNQEEDLNSPLVEEVIKAMIKRRQRGRIPLCLYCEKEARNKNNVERQRKKVTLEASTQLTHFPR